MNNAPESERVPLLERIQRIERPLIGSVKNTWHDYTLFLNKQNAIGLAIGIIIGGSFQKIVDSLVSDIFSPIFSLLSTQTFSETFVVLRHGSNSTLIYLTRDQAKTDGAITFNYGIFFENVTNFILMSIILFFTVKFFTKIFARHT
jgi:large conductance mechanosensitive channel